MQEQYQWEPDPDMEATRPAPIRVTTEFVKNCTLSFFVETQRPVLPFPNPPSLPP